MSDLKILYVAGEVDPFLQISEVSKLVRSLARDMRSNGAEVRILVPRFGIINERKNKLHEVVRLSGINIPIGNDHKPLIIKVASIREERLQVYFIDNEDYFKRKSIFSDKSGNFHVDNDERILFFSKGLLETIKELGWTPNIIHCNDWVSAFVPMYIKTLYKNEPAFKDSKTIFTVYDNSFPHLIDGQAILNKEELLKKESNILNNSGNFDFGSFIKIGSKYSDVVTKTSDTIHEDFQPYLEEIGNIAHIPHGEDTIEAYKNIYRQLLDSKQEVTSV